VELQELESLSQSILSPKTYGTKETRESSNQNFSLEQTGFPVPIDQLDRRPLKPTRFFEMRFLWCAVRLKVESSSNVQPSALIVDTVIVYKFSKLACKLQS